MKDVRKTIGSLIDRQSTAFIGSVSAEGFPNVKAMLAPRKRIGLKTMYFTSNTSSMRAAQYRDDSKACVYFCDRRFFRGVIWQEGDTMYYPLGVTDPDYCVLRFTAESGRYYSNFKSEDFSIES